MPFLELASTAPNEPALISDDGELTWSELEVAINRYSNGLNSLGLKPGDGVAVLSFNCIEFVVALLGNLRAGMRHIPINWHLTPGEISRILSDSGAKFLLSDPECLNVAREAASGEGGITIMEFSAEFDLWLSQQSDREPDNEQAGFILQYTSGTTGPQKGVVRSGIPDKVDGLLQSFRKTAEFWGFTEGGRHLVVCPLYHSAPPGVLLLALSFRQSIVVAKHFDALNTLKVIDKHQITTTHVVPTQLIRMLRLDDEVKASYNLSSLRGVWHGAAPCPAWAKRAAIDWLGEIVIEYFGSSEGTGPVIATSRDWLERPGTVGRPAPWLTITVRDDDGTELGAGEVGMLYFLRPSGPPSYRSDDNESSSSRHTDGSFTIGDVGWLDEAGYMFLADRKSDMIISGGVNIYPREVEAALLEHPDVFDAAVFGIPDSEWGEQVKAAVQLEKDASVTGEQLIAHCRERIANFKCPKSVDFHEHLPREASGKLKKRLLREVYWQVASGEVHA